MYAMLSTIETDRISQGDSVNLSVAFPLRRYIEEEAAEAMLGGRRHAITMRGTVCMALSLLNPYGAAPYDSYPAEGVNYDALARGVNAMARRSQSLGKPQLVGELTVGCRVGRPLAGHHHQRRPD